MSAGSPESPQELEYSYPPVRIDQSLAPLDLHTLIMRSQARPLPDEGHNSLADSSYEVLTKSMCETSDDEGNTESLASTDGQTPEDLSSLDGDEFDRDEDDYVNHESQHLPPPPADSTHEAAEAQYMHNPDDSMMTSTMETQHGEPSFLGFEEVSSAGRNMVNVCAIEAEFDEASGLPDIFLVYGYPEVRLSVKMALSSRFLPISRSFRLLYVGEFPDWAVKDVNNRIGAALNATPSPSRFNIVQDFDSVGTPSSSKVQLERSGSELVVDHCRTPEVSRQADGQSRVTVSLDDGSEIVFGPGRVIRPHSVTLPDLVIFGHSTIHSDSDSVAAEAQAEFRLARRIIKQHHIPSLDIAVVRPFTLEELAFDAESLRLCVEARPGQGHRFETQKTLPIDLYAFSSIDPSQLNQHLACLNDLSRSTGSREIEEHKERWNIRNMLSSLAKDAPYFGEWWPKSYSWASILGFTAIVIGYLLHSTLAPTLQLSSSKAAVESVRSASISLYPSSVVQVTPTSTSSTKLSSVLPSFTTSRDLTVVPSEDKSWTSWRNRSAAAKDDHAGSITIEVTGDHQFELRPSKNLINGKRMQLQIQVQRDSEAVPIRVARLSEDKYTVELEREYSAGTFNVSVVARRKPLLQQSFEIRLGTDKLAFSAIFKNVDRVSQAVKKDLATAQKNFNILTIHVSQGLHAGVARIENGAVSAFGQTRDWTRRLQDSTQIVASQWSVGSKVKRDVSKTLQENWNLCASRSAEIAQRVSSDIWQLSRPYRTAPRVLKARKRALLLRKKLEKRLGLAGDVVAEASEDTKPCKRNMGCRKL